MGKIRVEVCLISARGLRRTSSLWKLQWFAVGWIDPNNKYCTKIDASGNSNPVWKTKFSTLVDRSERNLQDLALHVEVYSREPIFLRERLQGEATVVLKEFLDKFGTNSEGVKTGNEEVGSFQLRKRNSRNPQGFADVSIQISEEREEQSSYQGGVHGTNFSANEEGFQLMDHSTGRTTLANENELPQPHPPQRPETHPQTISPYTHPIPFPSNYSNLSIGGPSYPPAGPPGYNPPRTPPPPPPPSNVGYIPTFLPRSDHVPSTYYNMPSSAAPPRGQNNGPGFGVGMGAGALAAGAVIFGDDFMSGFDFPDPSLTIYADPPF